MHHVERLFSNFACFFIVGAVAATVGEGCSANRVLAIAVPAVVHMKKL